MSKLPITEAYLVKTYKKEVNDLLDECDWISHIDDWRMCSIVASILNRKGLVTDTNNLLTLYTDKVKSLNLTTEQWCEEYGNWETGVPKIIGLIYEIIENNLVESN